MNTQIIWRFLASSVIILTLVASPLAAEEPIDRSEYPYCCREGQSSWGRGRNYLRYDSSKIETLNGEVISLDLYTSGVGTFQGTHLMLNTDRETIEVRVAPSWYLAEQDFDLTPQDKITIIGSRVNINGQEAIVAREIKKGDRTLVLRDRDGIPLWHRGQVPTINE